MMNVLVFIVFLLQIQLNVQLRDGKLLSFLLPFSFSVYTSKSLI